MAIKPCLVVLTLNIIRAPHLSLSLCAFYIIKFITQIAHQYIEHHLLEKWSVLVDAMLVFTLRDRSWNKRCNLLSHPGRSECLQADRACMQSRGAWEQCFVRKRTYTRTCYIFLAKLSNSTTLLCFSHDMHWQSESAIDLYTQPSSSDNSLHQRYI